MLSLLGKQRLLPMAQSKGYTALRLSLNALGFRDGGGGLTTNVTGEAKTTEFAFKVT